MTALVDSASAIVNGDTSALPKLGLATSVEERADLAAAGALLLAMDEVTLEQASRALAMVRPVPDADAAIAREDGRAYYFCSASCRDRFEVNPAAFAKSAETASQGKEHAHGTHH